MIDIQYILRLHNVYINQQPKLIVEFIKITPFKSYIVLILITWMIHNNLYCCCCFCLVIVVNESLVCPEHLNCLLFFIEILQVQQIVWFSSIFSIFEPFTMTVWFWDTSFHTKDKWGNCTQLLQKVQMLTDAPKGNKYALRARGVNVWTK